jgi:uncharacterized protein YndB with AHSA1/START domain
MQEVEVIRRFPEPPERVFAVYTDHAGWSRWAGVGSARLARQGSPDPNGTGALRVVGPGPFAAHEEVLDFEPPKRMTYRVVRGPIPFRDHFGEVRFEPDAGGTRVVWRCRFEPSLPGLGPLLRAIVTRVFRRALDGLAARGLPGA